MWRFCSGQDAHRTTPRKLTFWEMMNGEKSAYRTMAPLAKEFTKVRATEEPGFPTVAERKIFIDEFESILATRSTLTILNV